MSAEVDNERRANRTNLLLDSLYIPHVTKSNKHLLGIKRVKMKNR